MTTVQWPETLPQSFQISSYQEGLSASVIFAEYEAGPSGHRRRLTQQFRPVQGAMFMTTEEWETLQTFLTDETLDRELAFYFPDQREFVSGFLQLRDGVSYLLLRNGVDRLILDHEPLVLVLMNQPPSRTWLAEDFWLVTINLLILPTN